MSRRGGSDSGWCRWGSRGRIRSSGSCSCSCSSACRSRSGSFNRSSRASTKTPKSPPRPARPASISAPNELDTARAPSGGPSEAHQGTSLAATVLRQTRTGPITRITCQPQEGGSELHVDLPSAAARQLGLQSGEAVSITPRHVRVFLPDPEYVI
ncbi:MAG: hypothetical protein EXS06_12740 [Planctomycetaceae bacterium]|nr:hypothetical protein [Planctomycetaceae bacterium]